MIVRGCLLSFYVPCLDQNYAVCVGEPVAAVFIAFMTCFCCYRRSVGVGAQEVGLCRAWSADNL